MRYLIEVVVLEIRVVILEYKMELAHIVVVVHFPNEKSVGIHM